VNRAVVDDERRLGGRFGSEGDGRHRSDDSRKKPRRRRQACHAHEPETAEQEVLGEARFTGHGLILPEHEGLQISRCCHNFHQQLFTVTRIQDGLVVENRMKLTLCVNSRLAAIGWYFQQKADDHFHLLMRSQTRAASDVITVSAAESVLRSG
jgi:hypothetical protein